VCKDAIDKGEAVKATLQIANINRTVGKIEQSPHFAIEKHTQSTKSQTEIAVLAN
jgi:hypothetical protein